MSRIKAMAPPPPVGGKSKAISSNSSSESLSLVLMFDDLVRNEKVLNDGATEEKFLQFAVNQEFCRKRWEAAELEAQRMQIELQESEQEVKKLEMKLNQARELLAAESNARKKAESDRDSLAQKWEMVRELIGTDLGGQTTLADETRQRLVKLSASVLSRRETGVFSPGGAPTGLSPVCEIDSTGSILDASDLSFDATQGTMGADESRLRSGRVFKRKSSGGVAQVIRREKRSRSCGRDLNPNRKSLEALAAKRSVGGGGAAGLGEVLRNANVRYQERNIDDYIPSAPAMSTEDAVLAWRNAQNTLTPQASTVTIVSRTPTHQSSTATLTPTHPSTTTLTPTTPYTPANPVRRTHSNAGMNRKHQFVQKNNFKTEVCGPCQKRIKFGKVCYKCRECRAISHPECREKVALPCVPTGSAQKTPSKPGYGQVLADHTPHSSPMVPALIVYCINEIEARGLGEVGLYRVPGSEREVRELKEKFLAGRGCPNLSQADVHTLTGVVKDFLRSLREPLIPHSMWIMFTQAAANPDMTDGESDLFQAISELPQPNRETLAFILLHLQKVADSRETKMSISNLSKILGPTIVGYSTADPLPEDIMKEVGPQAATMEKLICVDADYWNTFLTGEEGEDLYRDNRILSPITPECIFRTPMVMDNGVNMNSITPGMATRRGSRRMERHDPGPLQSVQATTGRIFSSPVML